MNESRHLPLFSRKGWGRLWGTARVSSRGAFLERRVSACQPPSSVREVHGVPEMTRQECWTSVKEERVNPECGALPMPEVLC